MNLIGRITGIITNPRETVQDISENSHIEDAVLIIGIFAILSAIFGYMSQNIIIYEFIGMDQGDPGASSYSAASGSSVFTIIIGFISVIIGWIIVSGIVHLFSIALGGEGSFKKVLMINSYANIPLLLGTVVNLILISLMSPKNLVFDFSTVSSPFSIMFDMVEISTRALMSDPYYQVIYVITIVANLWTIGLVILGIKFIHDLSINRALIAVSILILLFIVGNGPTLYFMFS
ncbi:MAG: YIP1 family protein [ANME-2 cluster archaeon]|nr:YIP1 family protein [ANME-2 cluster archaeon]MBC2708779.1 YIP1 family protein [ANME-2 cluster archaeon]MBC2763100.1 YIP1 family protein [ANME-2 cluster archaeon]